MQLTLLLFRPLLSAVFGVAGVTKLLDQRGTREAVKNFGAPATLAPALALLLPIAELAIAVALLFKSYAWWGALAALLLLAVFILVIGLSLARGQTHDCHCFGQIYSRPLGWPTLARNIVFALGAGFVIWQGWRDAGPTVFASLAGFSAVQWLSLISLLVVAAAGLVSLQRRHKASKTRASALPKGLPLGSLLRRLSWLRMKAAPGRSHNCSMKGGPCCLFLRVRLADRASCFFRKFEIGSARMSNN